MEENIVKTTFCWTGFDFNIRWDHLKLIWTILGTIVHFFGFVFTYLSLKILVQKTEHEFEIRKLNSILHSSSWIQKFYPQESELKLEYISLTIKFYVQKYEVKSEYMFLNSNYL